MLKRLMSITAFAALALAAAPALADQYTDTIEVFRKAGQSGRHFANAYGYAVFPTIGKGGVVVGAAHGDGRVYEKGKYIGDTSMTQLSIGAQLGGQAYSMIIFFENKAALDTFTTGNFEFGADASAVAITAGADAKATTAGASASASLTKDVATTAASYYKGMRIYTVTKGGLMYEAALTGQKFSFKRR
jgi:lipid-binding SYLF domain-containing protein